LASNGPRRGFYLGNPVIEPSVKNVMAFIDGQNLYQHAMEAFGHHHPNYDPIKLHKAVCAIRGWRFKRSLTFLKNKTAKLIWRALFHLDQRHRPGAALIRRIGFRWIKSFTINASILEIIGQNDKLGISRNDLVPFAP
jgi:hypothetical protein